MNWDEYAKLIDEKLKDARINMELAEKSYRETKAIYESILIQREQYTALIGARINDWSAL